MMNPEKIKARQDEVMSTNKLTLFDRFNVKCDDRAKKLIKEETREVTSFPFFISSPYVASKLSPTELNFKKDLMIFMSLIYCQENLQ